MSFYSVWVVLSDFWDGSWKQQFILDCMLPRNREDSRTGILNNSYYKMRGMKQG